MQFRAKAMDHTRVTTPPPRFDEVEPQTLGIKIRNQGIMELKLLSVAFGLARDVISGGCITRQ